MDLLAFGLLFLIQTVPYGIAVLGLNINWGFTGLFNVGVAGFYAVGAYTSAILTAPEQLHSIAFGLPAGVGWLASMLTAAIVAYAIGKICLRLRSDYLAIATIGIAEILRLVIKNYQDLTGGTYGIQNLPRPFEFVGGYGADLAFLAVGIVIVAVLYILIERMWRSPWGRVMRAIRENEVAAAAAGKNVEAFRLEAFVVGSALMGLAGAIAVHASKSVGIEGTEPLEVTFLLWVMLIVGGSGNNKGALIGVVLIWALWSILPDFIAAGFLPLIESAFDLSEENVEDVSRRIPYVRLFLIGVLLQVVLQKFPGGLLREKAPSLAKHPAS